MGNDVAGIIFFKAGTERNKRSEENVAVGKWRAVEKQDGKPLEVEIVDSAGAVVCKWTVADTDWDEEPVYRGPWPVGTKFHQSFDSTSTKTWQITELVDCSHGRYNVREVTTRKRKRAGRSTAIQPEELEVFHWERCV